MQWLLTLATDQPLWLWTAAAAVLLAVEVATSSGWLLWPAACAGVVAVTVIVPMGIDGGAARVALFAVLTIVSTLLARRFLPRKAHEGHDINDRGGHLIGKAGVASGDFVNGFGRVMVDGSEWTAEAHEAKIVNGERVVVEKVIGGARLTVRPL